MTTVESLGLAHLAMLDQAEEILKKEVFDLRDAMWEEARSRSATLHRTFTVRQSTNRFRIDWQVMHHYSHKGEQKVRFTRITLNDSAKRPSYEQSFKRFGKVDNFHGDLLVRYDPLLATIRLKADMIGDLRVLHAKLHKLAQATEAEAE